MKSDSDAFLFTLRNPHGVAPTMYKVTDDGNMLIIVIHTLALCLVDGH